MTFTTNTATTFELILVIMIYIVLLCLPILIAAVAPVGSNRSFLGKDRRLQNGTSTEEASQPAILSNSNTVVYTSGYLRTDTYDWLGETWIQAQVLPIGQCFKDGSKGGSTQIAQIAMNADDVLRIAHLYDSSDCSGEFTSETFIETKSQIANQMEFATTHLETLEQALLLGPSHTTGTIVT